MKKRPIEKNLFQIGAGVERAHNKRERNQENCFHIISFSPVFSRTAGRVAVIGSAFVFLRSLSADNLDNSLDRSPGRNACGLLLFHATCATRGLSLLPQGTLK